MTLNKIGEKNGTEKVYPLVSIIYLRHILLRETLKAFNYHFYYGNVIKGTRLITEPYGNNVT